MRVEEADKEQEIILYAMSEQNDSDEGIILIIQCQHNYPNSTA